MPLLFLFALTACMNDETVSGFTSTKDWRLSTLDGAPFDEQATLTFPKAGKIEGQAPCNVYAGTITTPYPWFQIAELTVSSLSCLPPTREPEFFEALRSMSEAEVSGDILILRNDAGREMVFTAQ